MQQLTRGWNALEDVAGAVSALGIRRPLIVAGRHFADRVSDLLSGAPVFGGYHANPDWADAAAGEALYREHACDGLVSVGGGSAIDTAKAIKARLLAADEENALATRWQTRRLPHLAIPATAGTGAEATQFAVMYVGGRKHSLSHIDLLPDGVLLDPALLTSLPDYHKKSCALDALCQGIESYWAKASSPASRPDAVQAVVGVLKALPAYLQGDEDAADAMLWAAYCSGCAIQRTRTTAAHAMSYQITAMLGMAHGHACALTLPYLWAHLMRDKHQAEALQPLAEAMGLPEAAMVPDFLLGLLLALGMESIAAPTAQQLDLLTATVNADRLGNHPESLTPAEIRDIYAQALRPVPDEKRAGCEALFYECR